MSLLVGQIGGTHVECEVDEMLCEICVPQTDRRLWN